MFKVRKEVQVIRKALEVDVILTNGSKETLVFWDTFLLNSKSNELYRKNNPWDTYVGIKQGLPTFKRIFRTKKGNFISPKKVHTYLKTRHLEIPSSITLRKNIFTGQLSY